MKRKFNLKLLNKLVAISVVVCFFVSSVCRDAIAAVATPVTMNAQEYKQIFNDFMLPYSYGKISGSYFAGTDRVVINIQDLHCHPQVQKSISGIIEMFDNKYGVSNIYLEGAYGTLSAKPFLKNLTDITKRNEILDKLLESGRLTGAEYYSATSNKPEIIKGLEKERPYLENLKRFGTLLEIQDQIAVILKGVEESTKKVKKQYYTRRQYKIEKLSKQYLDGKIKAEKYYRLLSKHTEKLGIDLTKYENTFLYIQLLALQSELNYKEITKQLQTLVFLLKENLPPNAYQILLDNTKNFEQTDKLYAYIIKLSKSFGLDLAVNFKELNKYFTFIELSQKINPLELLKEEENLTKEISTRFSDTVAQREVVFLTNFEKYLKDYLTTKITADDYKYYKENIETYKNLWNKYVDNKVLTLLEPYMKETDKFYRINTARNNYFTENIFNGIETNKIENIKEETDEVNKIIENMDKVKRVDVIITGGFHSQTVSDILKQHGISYIVITPNVQDGVKEAEKTYYKIAKQQKEIDFQTLAAMPIFELYGIEAARIAFIKYLKDANISIEDAKDVIGKEHSHLIESIFGMSDEEFKEKYGSKHYEKIQEASSTNTESIDDFLTNLFSANYKREIRYNKQNGKINEKEAEENLKGYLGNAWEKISPEAKTQLIKLEIVGLFDENLKDFIIGAVAKSWNKKTVVYFGENDFYYEINGNKESYGYANNIKTKTDNGKIEVEENAIILNSKDENGKTTQDIWTINADNILENSEVMTTKSLSDIMKDREIKELSKKYMTELMPENMVEISENLESDAIDADVLIENIVEFINVVAPTYGIDISDKEELKKLTTKIVKSIKQNENKSLFGFFANIFKSDEDILITKIVRDFLIYSPKDIESIKNFLEYTKTNKKELQYDVYENDIYYVVGNKRVFLKASIEFKNKKSQAIEKVKKLNTELTNILEPYIEELDIENPEDEYKLNKLEIILNNENYTDEFVLNLRVSSQYGTTNIDEAIEKTEVEYIRKQKTEGIYEEEITEEKTVVKKTKAEFEKEIEDFNLFKDINNGNVRNRFEQLNKLMNEIEESSLLNPRDKKELQNELEKKVVELIEEQNINSFSPTAGNTKWSQNVLTINTFIKYVLNSELSNETKLKIIKNFNISKIVERKDIDNETKSKIINDFIKDISNSKLNDYIKLEIIDNTLSVIENSNINFDNNTKKIIINKEIDKLDISDNLKEQLTIYVKNNYNSKDLNELLIMFKNGFIDSVYQEIFVESVPSLKGKSINDYSPEELKSFEELKKYTNKEDAVIFFLFKKEAQEKGAKLVTTPNIVNNKFEFSYTYKNKNTGKTETKTFQDFKENFPLSFEEKIEELENIKQGEKLKQEIANSPLSSKDKEILIKKIDEKVLFEIKINELENNESVGQKLKREIRNSSLSWETKNNLTAKVDEKIKFEKEIEELGSSEQNENLKKDIRNSSLSSQAQNRLIEKIDKKAELEKSINNFTLCDKNVEQENNKTEYNKIDKEIKEVKEELQKPWWKQKEGIDYNKQFNKANEIAVNISKSSLSQEQKDKLNKQLEDIVYNSITETSLINLNETEMFNFVNIIINSELSDELKLKFFTKIFKNKNIYLNDKTKQLLEFEIKTRQFNFSTKDSKKEQQNLKKDIDSDKTLDNKDKDRLTSQLKYKEYEFRIQQLKFDDKDFGNKVETIKAEIDKDTTLISKNDLLSQLSYKKHEFKIQQLKLDDKNFENNIKNIKAGINSDNSLNSKDKNELLSKANYKKYESKIEQLQFNDKNFGNNINKIRTTINEDSSLSMETKNKLLELSDIKNLKKTEYDIENSGLNNRTKNNLIKQSREKYAIEKDIESLNYITDKDEQSSFVNKIIVKINNSSLSSEEKNNLKKRLTDTSKLLSAGEKTRLTNKETKKEPTYLETQADIYFERKSEEEKSKYENKINKLDVTDKKAVEKLNKEILADNKLTDKHKGLLLEQISDKQKTAIIDKIDNFEPEYIIKKKVNVDKIESNKDLGTADKKNISELVKEIKETYPKGHPDREKLLERLERNVNLNVVEEETEETDIKFQNSVNNNIVPIIEGFIFGPLAAQASLYLVSNILMISSPLVAIPLAIGGWLFIRYIIFNILQIKKEDIKKGTVWKNFKARLPAITKTSYLYITVIALSVLLGFFPIVPSIFILSNPFIAVSAITGIWLFMKYIVFNLFISLKNKTNREEKTVWKNFKAKLPAIKEIPHSYLIALALPIGLFSIFFVTGIAPTFASIFMLSMIIMTIPSTYIFMKNNKTGNIKLSVFDTVFGLYNESKYKTKVKEQKEQNKVDKKLSIENNITQLSLNEDTAEENVEEIIEEINVSSLSIRDKNELSKKLIAKIKESKLATEMGIALISRVIIENDIETLSFYRGNIEEIVEEITEEINNSPLISKDKNKLSNKLIDKIKKGESNIGKQNHLINIVKGIETPDSYLAKNYVDSFESKINNAEEQKDIVAIDDEIVKNIYLNDNQKSMLLEQLFEKGINIAEEQKDFVGIEDEIEKNTYLNDNQQKRRLIGQLFEKRINITKEQKDIANIENEIIKNIYLDGNQKRKLIAQLFEKRINIAEEQKDIIGIKDEIAKNTYLNGPQKESLNKQLKDKELEIKNETETETVETTDTGTITKIKNKIKGFIGNNDFTFSFGSPIATTASLISPVIKNLGVSDKTLSIYEIFIAPVWEEQLFGRLVSLGIMLFIASNPFGWMTGYIAFGLLICARLFFVFLHWLFADNKDTRNQKLTYRLKMELLLSLPYVISIFSGGMLDIGTATAISTIIHSSLNYIGNKYDLPTFNLFGFDKLKNIFGGNKKDDKLKLILEALDNDSKDFFVSFIKFAEVENKEEAENLIYILNKITAVSGSTTLAKNFINVIINIKKYNIVDSISDEELNEKNVKEIMNFIDINNLKNIYDNNNYNPSRAFHEVNKNITKKIISELRNNETNVVQELDDDIKEKICDNFGDFLFTKDGIALLRNLMKQNNENIEQILDTFSGIKQFMDDFLSKQIYFREKSFIPNFETFLSAEENLDNFSNFLDKLESKLNTNDEYSDADRNTIRTDLSMFLFRDKEIFDYFINNKENQDILLSNLSMINIENDKEYNGAIDFYRLPTDIGINLLMGYIKPVNLKEWYIQSPAGTDEIKGMETNINPVFLCGDETDFWKENKEIAKQRNYNDSKKAKDLFDAFCKSEIDTSENYSVADKIFKRKTGFSIDEIKNGITKDIMFRRNGKDLKKEQIKYSSEDIMAMYSDDIVYAVALTMKQKDKKENDIRNANFNRLVEENEEIKNYSFKCPLFDGPCFVPYSEILNTGYIMGDCTGNLAYGKNNVYFRNHRIFLKNFNTIIYYKNGKLAQKYMIHYDDNNMHIMSVEEHQDFRDNKNNQEDKDIDFKEQFFFESLDFIHNIAEDNGIEYIYIETGNSNTEWLMESVRKVTTKDKSESVNLLTQGGVEQLLKLDIDFDNMDSEINKIKDTARKVKVYRLLTGTGVYGSLVIVMYEIQHFINNINHQKELRNSLYSEIQLQMQEDDTRISNYAQKGHKQEKTNKFYEKVDEVKKLESILNNKNIEVENDKIKITSNTDVFFNFMDNFSEIVKYVPIHKLPGDEKGEQGFILPIGNNKYIEVELVKNGNVNLVNKKRYTKVKDESKVNTKIPGKGEGKYEYYDENGKPTDITEKIIKEISNEEIKRKQIEYNFKNEKINEKNKDEYKIEVIGIKEDRNLEVTFEIYKKEEKIGVCTCEINITDDLKADIKDSIGTGELLKDDEIENFTNKITTQGYDLNKRVRREIEEKKLTEIEISFETDEQLSNNQLTMGWLDGALTRVGLGIQDDNNWKQILRNRIINAIENPIIVLSLVFPSVGGKFIESHDNAEYRAEVIGDKMFYVLGGATNIFEGNAIVRLVKAIRFYFNNRTKLATRHNEVNDGNKVSFEKATNVAIDSVKTIINPVGLANVIVGDNVNIMGNIVVVDEDIDDDLRKQAENKGYTIYKKSISPEGVRGGHVIGSITINGKEHLIRLNLTKGKAIFYSNTINLNEISNINEKMEELMDKYVQDGVKNDKLGEDTILAFVSKADGFADITRSIEAKQTDYVMHGISSIHSFGEEEITLNKCDNIARTYGITTFSVSKTVYKDNLDRGNIDKDGMYKSKYPIIIEGDDVREVIVEDNQMECVLDFSKGEYDIERLKEIKGDILEQYGINVTVYIKLSEDTLKNLENDDIFEKTGIIPMVNAEYLEKGLTVNGKKGLYNINSKRQIKEQTDVVCVIFDKESEENLNKELSKKGLFNGVRTVVEMLSNVNTPQSKFDDGKTKALSSEKYNLNLEKKSIDEIVRNLKYLLEIDVTKEKANDEIKKQFNNLNLSELLSEDAAEYIQTRYVSKDNYIEALGFILGVVENSITDKMIYTIFDNDAINDNMINKIREDIQTNEVQGLLEFVINVMLTEGYENINVIEKVFKQLGNIEYENMTAKELYESKGKDLLKLNKVLDLLIISEYDGVKGYTQNVDDIITDISNIIPVIWEDRYGSFANVSKVRTVAIRELKSMLAAA